MEYECDIEGCHFIGKNPGALASHRYYQHGRGRADKELRDEVKVLINRFNQYRDSGSDLVCPDCGNILELKWFGPGLYILNCEKCSEGG